MALDPKGWWLLITSLLDLFRAFDGGVVGLSKASGVPQHTLYRIGNGAHTRVPVLQLSAVARAFAGRTVLGQVWSVEELIQKWKAARVGASSG